MHDDLVLEILRAYPQIYHACHVRHPRARTNVHRISARDAWILGHLDRAVPISPAALAKHLSIGAPTLSAALQRLERLGYVVRRPSARDKRRIELLLGPRGIEALRGSTVLDVQRVERLLAQLSKNDRGPAVAGLALLAKAARSLNHEEPRRWNDRDDT
jgi:DNA-binding MarR family transcriptional regulator